MGTFARMTRQCRFLNFEQAYSLQMGILVFGFMNCVFGTWVNVLIAAVSLLAAFSVEWLMCTWQHDDDECSEPPTRDSVLIAILFPVGAAVIAAFCLMIG